MALPNEGLYRITLIANSLKLPIKAWAPEEMTFGVESTWDSPLADVGSSLNVLTQATAGTSSLTKSQFSQVWQGSSPINITIPFRFFARSKDSAREDVVNPVRDLMKLAVPADEGLTLSPPGPVSLNVVNKLAKSGSAGIGDKIDISIGRFLRFKNVIVTQVSANLPLKFTADSIPQSITAEVTFNTHTVVTKNDLDAIFIQAR